MPDPVIYNYDIINTHHYRYVTMTYGEIHTTDHKRVMPDVGASSLKLYGIGLHYGPKNEKEL